MLTVTDESDIGLSATVVMLRFDGTHYQYHYKFTNPDGGILAEGKDLRISGVGAPFDRGTGLDAKAMRALADFLDAYVESQNSEDGEHNHLFSFPLFVLPMLGDFVSEMYWAVGSEE